MDGGWTKKRRKTPPIEKPMSWVDITTSHWSTGQLLFEHANVRQVGKELTAKVVDLVVIHSLDCDNVGCVCRCNTNGSLKKSV